MRFLALLVLFGSVAFASIIIVDGEMEFEGVGIYASHKKSSLEAIGVGFDASYKKRFSKSVWAGFGGTMALPLHENKSGAIRAAPELLEVEKSDLKGTGFYAINRMFVNIDDGQHSFQIGRFLIDSPLTQHQKERRFAPNSFEAIKYTFDTTKRISLHVGYLKGFSGHSSASKIKKTTLKGSFSAVSDALFVGKFTSLENSQVNDTGMLVAGIDLKHGLFESRAWFYSIPRLEIKNKRGQFGAYYTDFTYNLNNKDKGVGFGLQYTGVSSTKNYKDISHAIAGARVEVRVADDIALDLSYNSVSGKGGVFEVFGSRPAYTSGVETSIADLRKGNANRFGVHYNSEIFGVDLAYLQKKSKDRFTEATKKVDSYEVIGSFNIAKEFKNELRYVKNTKDDKSSLLLYRVSVKY